MKTVFILFAFLLMAFSAKADEFTNAQKQYLSTQNILKNAGFENGKTSWVSASSVFTIDAAAISGARSGKIVSSASQVNTYQSSTLYASAFASGVNGSVSAWINNTAPNVYLCQRQAGSLVATSNGTEITNCLPVRTDGIWSEYVLPIILGATSNGIAVVSLDPTTAALTNTTGTTYLDDAKVQAGDVRKSGASCNSIECETEFSAKVSSAGVVSGENYDWINGNCVISDTSLFTCNYKSGLSLSNPLNCTIITSSGNGLPSIATNTSVGLVVRTQAASSAGNVALSFEVVCQRSGTDFTNAKRLGNNQTYSASNMNYSRTQYTPTFTGFGTVTVHDCYHSRDGQYLDIDCKFTAGTTTAVEARVSLPNSLLSASSSGLRIAGTGGHNRSDASQANMYPSIDSGLGYFNFSRTQNSVAGLAKLNGNDVLSSGNVYAFVARIPIATWENSNQIIGSFEEVMTVPNVSKPKTCHYAFGGAGATLASPVNCTTGTCIEIYDSCGTASPPARNAAGVYNSLTFSSGTFSNSSFVDCDCDSYTTASATPRDCTPTFYTGGNAIGANPSGGYRMDIVINSASGTASDAFVKIKCSGSAP